MTGDALVVDASKLRNTAESFRKAAFDGSWEVALAGLSAACGGHAAQLIGVGSDAAVPFNRAHNIDPAGLAEFVAVRGGDPSRNARVRAGLRAPLLQPLTEADFGDIAAVLRSDLYADLFRRYDIQLNVQATLMRTERSVIGLGVIHSARRGVATPEEKLIFAALSPSIQDAVRLQISLEGHGARVLAGGLEGIGLAAFVSDAAGRIYAMTTEAERLVERQSHLSVTGGALKATHPLDAPVLAAALSRAGSYRTSPAREIALRAPADGALLVCQVASLPSRDFPFGFEASTLVVARVPRDLTKLTPVLQERYGLTLAEAGVAIAVARGLTIAQIARERASSEWTVRSQLKVAAAKLGLTRQAEIAAKLGRL